MAGFAVYAGLPEGEAEAGATYTVDVTLWGLMTLRGHVIEVKELDRVRRVLRSHEHGNSIRRWEHTLTVAPEDGSDAERARWTDSVVIDAGWRTWATARFAALVYRRRHQYRKALEITTRITQL